jgi:type II secretory pathway pseudopilin PulG
VDRCRIATAPVTARRPVGGQASMSAEWITLAVAVLGVAGTLSSPLLSQRIAAQVKEQEFDLQKRQRQEERDVSQRQKEFEERRSIYARLNTAARRYQQALEAYARAMADDTVTEEERAELAHTRQSFRDLYSDAQMILPDKVLNSAISVSASLGGAYGMIKRLETGKPRISPERNQIESIEMAYEYSHVTVYNQILELRQLMRANLGVSDQ